MPYWCNLQRPSLTALGRDDEGDNVPVERTVTLLQAMRSVAPEVDVRVYEGVGHGLDDPTGRLDAGFQADLVEWIHDTETYTSLPEDRRAEACAAHLGR